MRIRPLKAFAIFFMTNFLLPFPTAHSQRQSLRHDRRLRSDLKDPAVFALLLPVPAAPFPAAPLSADCIAEVKLSRGSIFWVPLSSTM